MTPLVDRFNDMSYRVSARYGSILTHHYLISIPTRRTTPLDLGLNGLSHNTPVSCRHTLEDEVDAPSVLLRCKSGWFNWWVEPKARSGLVNTVMQVLGITGKRCNPGYGETEIDHPWDSYVWR